MPTQSRQARQGEAGRSTVVPAVLDGELLVGLAVGEDGGLNRRDSATRHPKSGRAVSTGALDCGEYFSRLLRSSQVWGREISEYAEFSVKIGQDVWRLSALFALAKGSSAKVPW